MAIAPNRPELNLEEDLQRQQAQTLQQAAPVTTAPMAVASTGQPGGGATGSKPGGSPFVGIQQFLQANKGDTSTSNLVGGVAADKIGVEKEQFQKQASGVREDLSKGVQKAQGLKDTASQIVQSGIEKGGEGFLGQLQSAFGATNLKDPNFNLDISQNLQSLQRGIQSGPRSQEFYQQLDPFLREQAGRTLSRGESKLQQQFGVVDPNIEAATKQFGEQYEKLGQTERALEQDIKKAYGSAADQVSQAQEAARAQLGDISSQLSQKVEEQRLAEQQRQLNERRSQAVGAFDESISDVYGVLDKVDRGEPISYEDYMTLNRFDVRPFQGQNLSAKNLAGRALPEEIANRIRGEIASRKSGAYEGVVAPDMANIFVETPEQKAFRELQQFLVGAQ